MASPRGSGGGPVHLGRHDAPRLRPLPRPSPPHVPELGRDAEAEQLGTVPPRAASWSAVAFEELQPGDLLYFGTESRVDHPPGCGSSVAVQATAWDVRRRRSGVRRESATEGRFRYARRLAALPTARRPGAPGAAKLAALKAKLEALAAADGLPTASFSKISRTASGSGFVPPTRCARGLDHQDGRDARADA